jgi:glycosyltransferase involved in cell wall biosynthesis
MKIAVNGFIGLKGISGSSRGATLVEAALAEFHETIQIAPLRHSGHRVKKLLRMITWDILGCVRSAIRSKSDLVIHTANTGGSARGLPSIAIVHDTMVLDHPRAFSFGFVIYARAMFAYSVKRASRVVTPSEHSKRRILRRWPEAEVVVIPWPPFREQSTESVGHEDRHSTVLVVSSVDKHKRLPLAVSVVSAARSDGWKLKLILVTRPGNDSKTLESTISQFDPSSEWIEVRSGIPDDELQELYERATCLLVPSLDEGFCLPALEAGRCGTPVVHADRGALSEVVSYPSHFPMLPSAEGVADELALQRDAKLLIERLTWLREPDRWETASARAVEETSKFSFDRFRTEWHTVVTSVVG